MIINWGIGMIVGVICTLRIWFEYAQYRQQVLRLQQSMEKITNEMANYRTRATEYPLNNHHAAIIQSEKYAALQKKIDQNKSV